jgi:hypothetical protein
VEAALPQYCAIKPKNLDSDPIQSNSGRDQEQRVTHLRLSRNSKVGVTA